MGCGVNSGGWGQAAEWRCAHRGALQYDVGVRLVRCQQNPSSRPCRSSGGRLWRAHGGAMWQAAVPHPLSPFCDRQQHTIGTDDGGDARAVVAVLAVRENLDARVVRDVEWRGRRARAL